MLHSIARVLYSHGVIWRIWALYSSAPRFQIFSYLVVYPKVSLCELQPQVLQRFDFGMQSLISIVMRSLISLRSGMPAPQHHLRYAGAGGMTRKIDDAVDSDSLDLAFTGNKNLKQQ